jgi:hypothetical protein
MTLCPGASSSRRPFDQIAKNIPLKNVMWGWWEYVQALPGFQIMVRSIVSLGVGVFESYVLVITPLSSPSAQQEHKTPTRTMAYVSAVLVMNL